jgi:Cytochrome c7 and related cytochrome c
MALVLSVVTLAQTPPQSVPAATADTATENGPEQPLPYSHKIHAGTLGLACEHCHTLSRSGDAFSIPQAALCMQCHETIAATEPPIQKLAGYAQAGTPIPWVRIYQVPSFVTFSHKTHLDHGNTCQECHGRVAIRDRLSKETDISMAGCISCHRVKNAPTECNTCHELQQ